MMMTKVKKLYEFNYIKKRHSNDDMNDNQT